MYIIFVVTETIVLLYYIPLSVWRALFHRCSSAAVLRGGESVKSTVERGRNSWGDSPRDNGARKTSAPVAIVPTRGQWGVPIFPKLPRVDIAIESRPNCNWILRQTATRFPAKKKGRRACNLSIPISTDNRGLSLSSMTRPFLLSSRSWPNGV